MSIEATINDAKAEITAEIARRRRESLGIKVRYELKEIAKSMGALWDQKNKEWLFPNKIALEVFYKECFEEAAEKVMRVYNKLLEEGIIQKKKGKKV